jgi:hypothetical protein
VPDSATIAADPFLDEIYEYTEAPDFDEFGQPQSKYYFWVGNKGTRNENQEVSPRDAQTGLITMPDPYMITQTPLPADQRTNGIFADLTRTWSHILTEDALKHFDVHGNEHILLGSPVKEGDIANVNYVRLNNVTLTPTTEYTVSPSGRELEISIDYLASTQTEANYDGATELVWNDFAYVTGTLTNGTFSGGMGHAIGDNITLSDGSILLVTSVAAGVVDGFIITNSAGVSVTPSVALTQASTSGSGINFILTPELPNIGLGLNDTLEVEYVTEIPTEIFEFPDRQTQAIIRGLRGLVTSNRRFTLRYTRDFTLRDNLDNGNTALDLKQTHQEWQLIREEQPFLIPRELWDRVTEAIVGFELDNTGTRVPSLERELYDTTYGTDTRFGLGDGQAFTDGATALQTILSDLQNPENDFPAVDINTFFATNSFDTDDNIIAAMATIYNTFTFTDVNRIWFSVLHDAFSFKKEYPDIFKTSMVAIHGIRPFQVAGLFDD